MRSRLEQNELPQTASWSLLTNYNNLNSKSINYEHQNLIQSSSSFTEEYRSQSSPTKALRRTPVCSDNEDDDDNKMDEDEFENFFLPNLQPTPGAKQWYMAFPSDNDDDDDDNENELKHNISTTPLHTKSEPTLQCKLMNRPQYLIPEYSNNVFTNNNSLSSLDFDLGIDTENLQQQQTDIFSSATYNAYDSFSRLDKITKNQLYSEGVNIDSNHVSLNKKEEDGNNNNNVTMMGYMNGSNNNLFGLRLNNSSQNIPAQWRSNLYSEGNIICDTDSDKEFVPSDEGTNDGFTHHLPMFKLSDDNDDSDEDDDDDDLDGFVNNKHETLMGPIHTNDGYLSDKHLNDNNDNDSDIDEDDDIFIDNKQKAMTLMGGLDLKDRISFNVKNPVQNKNKNKNENENNKIDFNFNINEIGITLMGHFENGVDQKIPFKNE